MNSGIESFQLDSVLSDIDERSGIDFKRSEDEDSYIENSSVDAQPLEHPDSAAQDQRLSTLQKNDDRVKDVPTASVGTTIDTSGIPGDYTVEARSPGSVDPSLGMHANSEALERILKAKEQADNRRFHYILIAAAVTVLVVVAVSLCFIFLYNPNSENDKPNWAEEDSEQLGTNAPVLKTRIPMPSTSPPEVSLAPTVFVKTPSLPPFTAKPTIAPTRLPTRGPTLLTMAPFRVTTAPTDSPVPSPSPSAEPTATSKPSASPSSPKPTRSPSREPSKSASPSASAEPTVSARPSRSPTSSPTISVQPSKLPTRLPSAAPSKFMGMRTRRN